MDTTKKSETLYINLSSSYCGKCGKECDPNEKRHETNLGWDEETRKKKGCGVVWKYVDSDYRGCKMKEASARMRPDLICLIEEF